MSRRFGRNQRRQLREDLAGAQAAVMAAANGQLRAQMAVTEKEREISYLRQMLSDVQQRAGKYALVGAEPRAWEHRNLDLTDEHNFHMSAKPSLRPTSYSDCRDMRQTVKVHDDLMAIMSLELREGMSVQEHLAKEMHCRLYFDKLAIGYAISHSAIRNQSREEFVRRVAPEIAFFLEKELRKVGMR